MTFPPIDNMMNRPIKTGKVKVPCLVCNGKCVVVREIPTADGDTIEEIKPCDNPECVGGYEEKEVQW